MAMEIIRLMFTKGTNSSPLKRTAQILHNSLKEKYELLKIVRN